MGSHRQSQHEVGCLVEAADVLQLRESIGELKRNPSAPPLHSPRTFDSSLIMLDDRTSSRVMACLEVLHPSSLRSRRDRDDAKLGAKRE